MNYLLIELLQVCSGVNSTAMHCPTPNLKEADFIDIFTELVPRKPVSEEPAEPDSITTETSAPTTVQDFTESLAATTAEPQIKPTRKRRQAASNIPDGK